MKYNKLGNTGLLVSELSLGSWVTFSDKGQVPDYELAFDIMKKAYDAGVNFFDNAEAYSHGEAETIMGKAVQIGIERKAWKRSDLVLSTKIFFGAMVPENHPDYIPNARRENRTGLSRKHIIEGTEESLQRMGLKCVDLVFCHRFDPVANVEEVVRAFNFLIDQGMCHYWGTSEWSAEEIREAQGIAERLGLVGPAFDQPQYHMFDRTRVELEYARLYPNVGLTTWSPLAYGVLTGKYKDGVPEGSRLSQEMFKDSRKSDTTKDRIQKTEQLRPIAKKLDCTLAQLALAWCAVNPNVSTVITGASSVDQVVENMKAVEVIPKLTPDVMDEIEKIIQSKPKLPSSISMPMNVRNVKSISNINLPHKM